MENSWLVLVHLQSALQQCCIQLKSKIVRQQQARDRQLRKRSLAKYGVTFRIKMCFSSYGLIHILA